MRHLVVMRDNTDLYVEASVSAEAGDCKLRG